MNVKAITAFLVLAGILSGYKLGQRTATNAIPEATAPTALPSSSAIARASAKRDKPSEFRKQVEDLATILRRVRAGLKSSSSYLRSAAIAGAIRNLPVEQFPAALEQLRGDISGSYGYTILYVMLPIWAERDPMAALEFANSLVSSRRSAGISSVLRGWVSRDLEGAIAYVQAMPLGSQRTSAASAIVSAMAEQDPRRALHSSAVRASPPRVRPARWQTCFPPGVTLTHRLPPLKS